MCMKEQLSIASSNTLQRNKPRFATLQIIQASIMGGTRVCSRGGEENQGAQASMVSRPNIEGRDEAFLTQVEIYHIPSMVLCKRTCSTSPNVAKRGEIVVKKTIKEVRTKRLFADLCGILTGAPMCHPHGRSEGNR